MHGNDARSRENKNITTHCPPMLRCASECASRSFFYMLKRTSIHIFFKACIAFTARPKTKGRRDLSLPRAHAHTHIYIYLYTQQKSLRDFFLLSFDESDKPDRKSLQQVTHGVIKQEESARTGKRKNEEKELI